MPLFYKVTAIIAFMALLTASPLIVEKVSDHKLNQEVTHIIVPTDIHNKKYTEWMQSVVRIEIPLNDNKSLMAGSGWIISTDGTIITNYHVIKSMIDGEGKEIDVSFADGTTAKAVVIGGDEAGDVGIIKVNVKKTLRAVTLGDSSKVVWGQDVYLMGNPQDQGLTLTHGVVANVPMILNEFPFLYIESDATINPGNSGGALFDANGDLIGMPSILASGEHGGNSYSFSIASNDIKWSIEKIMSRADMTRVRLGVRMKQRKTDDLAQGVMRDAGVQVVDSLNSLLLKDDVVTAVNGVPTLSFEKFHEIMGKTLVGDQLVFTVIRNRVEITVDLTGAIAFLPKPIMLLDKDRLHKK